MAKKPRRSRIDRSSEKFQERLEGYREARRKGEIERKQTRKDYAKRAFGEFLLGSYGFGEEDFSKGGFVKGKLGLFAEAAKNKHQLADKTHIPPEMEPAHQEREKTNPEISTLIQQLDTIIKVAHRIGVITAAQQKDLQDQLATTARNYKENQMEMDRTAMQSNMTSADLTPLTSEISTLIKKIDPFKKIVDEKVKEQEEEKFAQRGFMQRLAENYGFGDEYEDYTRKKKIRESRVKTKPDVVSRLDKSGRMRYYRPDPVTGNLKRLKNAEAIADAVPTRMQRMTGAARSTGQGLVNVVQRATTGATRMAGRVGGASLAARGVGLSSKISSLIGKGVRGAGVSASTTKNVTVSVVKKIAGPIIQKAIGHNVLKMIPIVGAIGGVAYAAKKLVEGDVLGAGLEAASGLAGPLTAIPAMIATVARDTYSSVFNIQPEQDPNFGIRMKLITGIVGRLVTEMLASKIETKPLPTKDQVAKIETPRTPPAQPEAKTPPTGGPPIRQAPQVSEQPTPTPSPSPQSTSGNDAPPSAPRRRDSASTDSGRDTATSTDSPSQQMVTPPPTSGTEVSQMSTEVENMANQPLVVNLGNQSVPLPSVSPPTKSGVSGAGDVPDPIYYGMGAIVFQVYFNSNPATTT